MPILYDISEEYNKSEELSEFLLLMLEEDREVIPRLSLGELLTAKTRPGMSAAQLSSRIIGRFKEAGIPNGPLRDGNPNSMEILMKVIAEEIVGMIQDEMRVDIAVDAGLLGQGVGSNAAGPVLTQNTTLNPHTGIGVAR